MNNTITIYKSKVNDACNNYINNGLLTKDCSIEMDNKVYKVVNVEDTSSCIVIHLELLYELSDIGEVIGK